MRYLVVGSGLSAYGACLALIDNGINNITVMDIGHIRSNRADCKCVMNGVSPDETYFEYGINDASSPFVLTSKRLCSSHAYGGYSTVYSGSILRPQDSDLIGWPDEAKPPRSIYKRILDSLVINGFGDELEAFSSKDGNGVDEACQKDCYLGEARIAVGSKEGGLAGEVPFCSKDAFSKWRIQGKIRYKGNVYVQCMNVTTPRGVRVGIVEEHVFREEVYDVVLLGAGCINTTIVINNSLKSSESLSYKIHSCPIVLASYLRIGDVSEKNINRRAPYQDKCEYFLEGKSVSSADMWTHTQLGPLNSHIKRSALEKCPRAARPFIELFLDRLWFSISTLNSTLGRPAVLEARREKATEQTSYTIHEQHVVLPRGYRLALSMWILKNFRKLKLIPIPFSGTAGDIIRGNSLGGWHFGGTIPMVSKMGKSPQCHPDGMVEGLEGVYIVDSSGFPSIPGSSVALLTMANAYHVSLKALRK